MKRFHTDPDATLLGMVDDGCDSIHHHLSRPTDVFIRGRPVNKHQQVGTYSDSLIDCTEVIFDSLLTLFRSGSWKHASPTKTRHSHLCITQSLPYRCWILAKGVAPGRDPPNPEFQTCVHDVAQRGFACRHLIETESFEVSH
jgi:hypothetical protein